MNIENFTWGKCLNYPIYDDRVKYCDILFNSNSDIKMCKVKFSLIRKTSVLNAALNSLIRLII